tara:strand:+ start:294 stop:542 length:249 start_codon:yes stop_codon:yes gene_type:complete
MIILKKMNMNIVQEAIDFEKSKMSNMSTSDRINASREAKRFILGINEIYKETNDPDLMELMKRLTAKKKKIEVRLNGRPEAI